MTDLEQAATPKTDAVACDGWSGDACCVSYEFAQAQERHIIQLEQAASDMAKAFLEMQSNNHWEQRDVHMAAKQSAYEAAAKVLALTQGK